MTVLEVIALLSLIIAVVDLCLKIFKDNGKGNNS